VPDVTPFAGKTRTRLIARLDIKAPNLIKGIRLEGLRVVGAPDVFARRYYAQGLDELIYMDCVASLYNRNSLGDLVQRTAEKVFVPLTVGGGVRTLEDVEALLRCGADKVAVNTAAHARPELLSDIANRFGSQCVVLSIEAKRTGPGNWEAVTNNGRDHTGRGVAEWASQGAKLGAGEILLTSVDQEGTRKGYDIDLIRTVAGSVGVPVIASGGMGTPAHLEDAVRDGLADAVAVADALHYERFSVEEMRRAIARGEAAP
jgi:cyclase